MTDDAAPEPQVKRVENRGNAFVQFYRYVLGKGYERNVGGSERLFRYVAGTVFTLAGLGIVASPVLGSSAANAVLAFLLIVGGLYLIYEAQVQYCPLNQTFGRSTYPGE